MASLWANNDAEAWAATLEGYWSAVEGLGKDRLLDLDRWYQEQLPAVLQGRVGDPHITKAELVKLVDWKMTRGKRRPRLLDFAKAAVPAEVEAASRAAFAALRGGGGGGGGGGSSSGAAAPGEAAIREALDALCVLKGVGPATASAVLEAFDASVPFTSDQAMQAALGEKYYTVAKVLQLTRELRAKAAALGAAGDRQWSAKDVERALYAAAVQGGGGGGGSGGGGKGGSAKKRKR